MAFSTSPSLPITNFGPWRQLFEAVSDPILLLNSVQGESAFVMDANPACLKLFGNSTLAELKGLPVLDCVYPEDRIKFVTLCEAPEKMTRGPEAAFRILRRDGSTRFVTGESRTIPELSLLQLRMVEQKEKEWDTKASALSLEVAQVVVDEVSNGIQIFSAKGNELYSNPVATQLKNDGLKENDLSSTPERSRLAPHYEDQNAKTLSQHELPRFKAAKSLTAQGPRLLRCWLPKAKMPRWQVVKAIPQLSKTGELESVIEIIQDVTSLILAEKKRSEYEHFMTASPDLILEVEKDLIYSLNTTWSKLFGLKPEELKGKPILDFIHPEDKEVFEAGMNLLRKGEVWNQCCSRFLAKNGEGYWLQWSGVPIISEMRFLMMARDLTEIKRSQKELLNSKLAAEASNQIKSRYLLEISQELRSPMTGIVSMTDLLDLTPLDDEQYCLLKTLRASANSMVEVLSRLTDFASLAKEAIVLGHEPFEVVASLQNAVNKVSALVALKSIEIRIKSQAQKLRVVGDVKRFEQVVVCLLSHAAKAQEQSSINIRVELEKDRLEWMRLRVEIEECATGSEEQEGPNRLASAEKINVTPSLEDENAIISLVHAKELVDLWGGQLGADYRSAGGTRFWFTLPTQLQNSMSERPIPTQDDQDHSFVSSHEIILEPTLKITVCDDHALNREVICRVLESLGHSVRLAGSGEELLNTLAVGPWPDIILLDCQMPVMDGFRVAKHIRNMEAKGRRQIIIALTADAIQGTRKKCLDAGMDDYITKPVIRFELQSTLLKNYRRLGSKAHNPKSELLDRETVEVLFSTDFDQQGSLPKSVIITFGKRVYEIISRLKQEWLQREFEKMAQSVQNLIALGQPFGAKAFCHFCEILNNDIVLRDLEAISLHLEKMEDLLDATLESLLGILRVLEQTES